jgi:hypothetical protein
MLRQDNIAGAYTVNPATPEEIDWITHLEANTYSQDAVPGPVLKEWYESNPDGFSILRMNGQKIGHLDILPVRPQTLGLFLEGSITEREIRGDSLYTPAEKELVRNLYVESIIIQLPPGYTSNASARPVMALLCNFIQLTGRVANPDNIENVYAVAASQAGKGFMKKLGFELARSGQERKDRLDFYVVRFDSLKGRISALCKRWIRHTRSRIS